MRILLCLFALIALLGCDAPFYVGKGPAPLWSTTQEAPVLTQQWQDGFTPVERWKADTLRVYGSGRWEAMRAYAPSTQKPSEVMASGSISQEALGGILAKAFERPLGAQSFLDLPAKVDPGITDAPAQMLAVSIDNASHSVTVLGPRPEPFERLRAAVASQTVAIPLSE